MHMKRSKKFLYFVCMCLLVLVLMEFISFVFISNQNKKLFSYGKYIDKLQVARSSNMMDNIEQKKAISPEILHPYMGFTYNPENTSEEFIAFHSLPISEYGFIDDKSPIQKKSDDKVIIGIFGGSVAYWLSCKGIEPLIDKLKEVPEFLGKEFVVTRVALGGYKQPQQLSALSYLLSQGAEYDIVINLDGFNEVALARGNVKAGVFPFYPRNWRRRVEWLPDMYAQSLVGRVYLNMKKRTDIANVIFRSPLRYSVTIALGWEYYNKVLLNKINKLWTEIEPYSGSDSKSKTIGPSFKYSNSEEMYKDCVDVWLRSSIQMNNLCVSNDILFFHFLQPNANVVISKKLTPYEKNVALHKGQYDKGVGYAYTNLKEFGRQ